MQDMFVATMVILDILVAAPGQAAQVSQNTAAVKQMEAVAQILLRRVDIESKYLARLEGKGAYMTYSCCSNSERGSHDMSQLHMP